MNRDDIHTRLIGMMVDANVLGLSDERKQAFLRGETDIVFEELGMDSLARMEFCIAMELEWGVSIVPARLVQLRTLNALAQEVLKRVL